LIYASGTSVTVDRSRAEIESLLRRYGADQFVSGWEAGRRALIGFRAHGKQVRFELTLPDPGDPIFQPKRRLHRRYNSASRSYVNVGASGDRYEAEVRRRWRALALVVKAKLEAVATGITTFETEFMAHIVMPDGRTVGDHVRPRIEAAYASGKMQPLLPVGGELP
jgi:hypothetical protein